MHQDLLISYLLPIPNYSETQQLKQKAFVISHTFLWIRNFGAAWLSGSNLGLHDAGCSPAVGWGSNTLSWRIRDVSFTWVLTRGPSSLVADGRRPRFLCGLHIRAAWVSSQRGTWFSPEWVTPERQKQQKPHYLLWATLESHSVTSATFCSFKASH